jgi:hypothetical protein
MSDVESGLAEQDSPDESQVGDVSDSETTSSISQDLSDAQIEKVLANPKFESMVQRHSNRAISNLEKKVDEISTLDRYRQLTSQSGEALTHDAAKERLKFEQDIEWLKARRGEPIGGELIGEPAPERASSINYNAAYKNVGVEPPDTEEDIAWALRFQSQDDFENALWENKQKAALSTKPASPGTAISPGGGRSPAPVEVDDLVEELVELQKGDTDIARQEAIEELLKESGAWA